MELGGEAVSGASAVPIDGEFYVSTSGSDEQGTGAPLAPYRTVAFAVEQADAAGGGTVYLGRGRHDNTQIEDKAGTALNPIRITTLPIDKHFAYFEGDLHRHVAQGGTGEGVPATSGANEANRDGIRLARCEHIIIQNIRFQNFWRAGVFITGGTYGDTYLGNQVIDCVIENTGSSSIVVQGKPGTSALTETETVAFLGDVYIANNICTFSNQFNDYNNLVVEGVPVAGADTEILSVVWGVDGITVEDNLLEDGLNYGPDFKVGVRNFVFRRNTVRRMRKFGVYMDTGARDLVNGQVYDNLIEDVEIGVVFAREAAPVAYSEPGSGGYAQAVIDLGAGYFIQKFDNVAVYNNIIRRTDLGGILAYRHPRDGANGEITDVVIAYNTIIDANRDGGANDVRLAGWADADFLSASIVTGFKFIGNIIHNTTANIDIEDQFTGETGFTVRHNFNFADGAPTDPRFTNPAAGDYTLLSDSSAIGIVDTAGDADAPLNVGRGGRERLIPAAAGAFVANALITELEVTGAQTGGDLPVDVTVSGAITGRAWGIGTGSTPTLAALRAGTGMTDFGTVNLPTSGAVNITLASEIDETALNLWMDAGDDTVITATGSVPFAIDTTTGGFTETAVTVGTGNYLTATSALPTGQGAGLLFASLQADSALEAAERLVLASWNGIDGGAHANWTVGNGLVGLRTEVTDGVANLTENSAGETIAVARRYHVLWSFWTTDTELRSIVYLYDTVAGTWAEVINATEPSVGVTTLDLGPDNLRIFARSDTAAHNYGDDVWRVAFWTHATKSPIADITNAAVRNEFIDGASISDPATTQATYSAATRLVDFYGAASRWNTPTNDGTLTFTATGTFT